jgi:hypothetical protein
VLPAGGVALSWLLLMTLWLPLLDYGRSNRPLISRLARELPAQGCLAAPNAPLSLVAALEVHAHRRVDARPDAATSACPVLVQVLVERGPAAARSKAAADMLLRQGWAERARARGPTERSEVVVVYRRANAAAAD